MKSILCSTCLGILSFKIFTFPKLNVLYSQGDVMIKTLLNINFKLKTKFKLKFY